MKKRVLFFHVSAAIVKSIAKYTFFGTLISWFLLAFVGRNFFYFGLQLAGQMGPAARAGVVAILLAVIFATPAIALFLLFLVGFPFAYFLVGKKVGIQRGLALLITHYLSDFTDYLSAKIFSQLQTVSSKLDSSHPQFLETSFKTALRRLDDIPWPLRLALRPVFQNLDYAEIIREQGAATNSNSAAFAERLKATLKRDLEERIQPSNRLFLLIVGVEVAVFIACKIFLPSTVQWLVEINP